MHFRLFIYGVLVHLIHFRTFVYGLFIYLILLNLMLYNFFDGYHGLKIIAFNILLFMVPLIIFCENKRHYIRDIKLRLLEDLSCFLSDGLMIFDQDGIPIYSTHLRQPSFADYIEDLSKNYRDIKRSTFNELRAGKEAESLLKNNNEFHLVECKKFKNFNIFNLKNITKHLGLLGRAQSSYEDLKRFVEHASFGLIYTDLDHKIIGYNETALASFTKIENLKTIDMIIPELLSIKSKMLPAHTVTQNGKYLIYSSCLNRTAIVHLILPYQNSLDAFQVSRIPSVLINGEGLIISYNKAYEECFGITSKNFFEVIHPSSRSEIKSKYQRVVGNLNEVKPFEVIFNHNDITTTTYTSRLLENGLFLLQFIDNSEQKQLERQFIQSQKMQAIGQLAGGIAHDFNNLLTAILGYCDLLLQKYIPNDPAYNDLIQIKQNAVRATTLVKQLLAFSRQQNFQSRVIKLTDSLADLTILLNRLIGAGIALDIKHGRDLWPIKVDPGQLEQVIINLAVNSRDAMEGKGKLSIKTENYIASKDVQIGHEIMAAGQYVTIELSDTGCGIPPENIEHIFEPFFSTKDLGAGTGLGLSTAYGIVKQTGGFIGVKSRVNQGTTFTIYIPAYDEKIVTKQEVETHVIEDLTGKGRILFVEDEDAVRTFGVRALREKGYHVTETSSGEQALCLLEKGNVYDVVITDVVMPKVDGSALSKRISELYPSTKIIFMSGYAEDTFRKRLDRDVDLPFLQKPFSIKELASKVKEVLNSK